MTTTATHASHHTTAERVLFMAFELSEKSWKLGFTTGPGQKPRECGVTAHSQARVLQEIADAKKRFGLPDTAQPCTYPLGIPACGAGGPDTQPAGRPTPDTALLPDQRFNLLHK
jgi:hypothetical protein